MPMRFDLGDFDLNIALKDAASNAAIPQARRDLARACIGTDAFEAYYVTYELAEVLRAEHEGVSERALASPKWLSKSEVHSGATLSRL